MRISAIEGHRLWASIYDRSLNPLLALERRTMREFLKRLQPANVLDVACGTGQWMLQFQRAGSNVFGCDACQEMLSEAIKAASLRGRVALGNAEGIPFGDSIADLVFCSVSLGYFQDLERVFHEFARAAKPGGFVALSDLHPEALAAGWTRSFKLGEQVYELAHYPRALKEVDAAARHAGLRFEDSRDIFFDTPELELFRRARKEAMFSIAMKTPALFFGLWGKPC